MPAINSHNQLYTASAVKALTSDCGDMHPIAYIDSMQQCGYGDQPFFTKVLNPMAIWIDPTGDPVHDYSGMRYAEQTFRRAGLIGMRIAEACDTQNLLQTMVRVNLLGAPAPSVEAGEWFDGSKGDALFRAGEAEYTRLCNATDESSVALSSLLRKWTPKVAQEQEAERLFGPGVGMVTLYALRALELPDYEEMAQGSMSPADFDALLGRTE